MPELFVFLRDQRVSGRASQGSCLGARMESGRPSPRSSPREGRGQGGKRAGRGFGGTGSQAPADAACSGKDRGRCLRVPAGSPRPTAEFKLTHDPFGHLLSGHAVPQTRSYEHRRPNTVQQTPGTDRVARWLPGPSIAMTPLRLKGRDVKCPVAEPHALHCALANAGYVSAISAATRVRSSASASAGSAAVTGTPAGAR